MKDSSNKINLSSRLNKIVVIEETTETPDTAGGFTESWSTKTAIWAEIRPISGREIMKAEQITDTVTHIITTRYIDGITPKMRIKYNSRYFNIRYVINVLEKSEMLEMLVEEE